MKILFPRYSQEMSDPVKHLGLNYLKIDIYIPADVWWGSCTLSVEIWPTSYHFNAPGGVYAVRMLTCVYACWCVCSVVSVFNRCSIFSDMLFYCSGCPVLIKNFQGHVYSSGQRVVTCFPVMRSQNSLNDHEFFVWFKWSWFSQQRASNRAGRTQVIVASGVTERDVLMSLKSIIIQFENCSICERWGIIIHTWQYYPR